MLIRGVVSSPVRGVVGSGFGGDTFSLDAFMASQSAGFWYNFLRDDTMFQKDVGPTPADGPNEVIGLALSQRLWGGQTRTGYLAGQPELVANGDFASGLDNWADAGGNGSAVVVGGVLQITEGTSREERRQVLTVVAGRTYRISATLGGSLPVLYLGSTTSGANLGNIQATGERFITATTTTLSIRLQTLNTLGSGLTATFDDISVREVSQVPATQSTTSFKPKFQTTGAAFDGTDDNLLTNYTAGSGANFMIAKVVVPASLAETQVIIGANAALDAGRVRLGITTAGRLRLSVEGVDLDGSTDLRGQTVVVGATTDPVSGQVRTFAGSSQQAASAAAAALTTTIPLRIGARNNDGAAANFFGGSIQHVLAGREFIDLARFNQIANALGA